MRPLGKGPRDDLPSTVRAAIVGLHLSDRAATQTREAALIDPVLETVERDLALLGELGLTLKYTIETHIHADHVTGAARLRDATGCKAARAGEERRRRMSTSPVREGEPIAVGKLRARSRSTRPATPTIITAYLLTAADGARVFTGDALMIDGCGRTDFQNGDAATLYRSVHDKIFALPDDTLVYPGHDYQQRQVSSVGQETRAQPAARRRQERRRVRRDHGRRSTCRGRRRWTSPFPPTASAAKSRSPSRRSSG